MDAPYKTVLDTTETDLVILVAGTNTIHLSRIDCFGMCSDAMAGMCVLMAPQSACLFLHKLPLSLSTRWF